MPERKRVFRPGARPGSSFKVVDPDMVFDLMGDLQGLRVLELGCGPGDYTRRFSQEVGGDGTVHALDKNELAIDTLEAEVSLLGNVRLSAHDLTRELPVEDASVDICLISTVLHIVGLGHTGTLFPEIMRVLAPGGRLVVIECNKEEQPWGPPFERRIAPQSLIEAAEPHGFQSGNLHDLGGLYLLTFSA